MFSQVAIDDCQRYAGLKVLLLRKTAKAMKEQIRDLLVKICKGVEYNYREQVGKIEFKNGSFIIVGHFKDEKEIENYIGQEYDCIAIEELTTLTFEKFKNLTTCLRSSKPNWRPRLYAAWNWGGIGHFWVKKVFYEPWKSQAECETRYILARVDDNAHNNPEYVNTLKSLTGWKYQSWYLGNPDFQAGQFFTNWNEQVHVFPNAKTNFNYKLAVSWAASYDYGFGHPSAFHLHCKDEKGRKYTFGEWHKAETVIAEQAEEFKSLCRSFGVDINSLEFIAAGKDCFSRKPDGRTIAQEFEDHGIILVPVEIDRVNAWAVMQQSFGDVEKGIEPEWFIHRSCRNLIAQIPMAQHHETRIGDIQKMNADPETGEGGDDAIEGARNYLVCDMGGSMKICSPVAITQYQPAAISFGLRRPQLLR